MNKVSLGIKSIILGVFALTLSLGQQVYAVVDNHNQGSKLLGKSSKVKEVKYLPGQIVVKLKMGRDVKELDSLLSKYQVEKIEKFDLTELNPEEKIKELERKVKNLDQSKEITQQIQAQKELLTRLQARQKRALSNAKKVSMDNLYLFHFDKKINLEQAIVDFQSNPAVVYAEPNYLVEICKTPNDPYFSSSGSWGQNYDDLWGLKKLQTQDAWDLSQGEGVVVAVVDTGVNYNHEDITENIWVNKGEIPDNGIDDDDNGLIDDVYGYDFVNSDPDPLDGNGHGTHVSATIAGVGDNSVGVVGVAPKAKIMAIKGLSDEGSGSTYDLGKGLFYAVLSGADIINNSWGGLGVAKIIEDSLDLAYSKGCVIVAAAGNENSNTSSFIPSNHKNVISVAASSVEDKRASFSNWGYKVDLSAPGVEILSAMADDAKIAQENPDLQVSPGYYRLNGTSMASPHVAGLAALILSYYANDINNTYNDAIRGRMIATVDKLKEDYYGVVGSGRINAYRALTQEPKPFFLVRDADFVEQVGDGDGIPESGEKIGLIVTVENVWKDAQAVTVKAKTSSTAVYLTTGSSYLGSIVQREKKNNQSTPFLFEVATINNETPVTFTLTFEAAGGVIQTKDIVVYLGSKHVAKSSNLEQPKASVFGDKMVWVDERDLDVNVFLYDFLTKKETQLTKDSYTQSGVDIYGDIVVWVDNSDGYSNLYAYNLVTQKKTQITKNNFGSVNTPDIWGDKVVWTDSRNGHWNIYLYDLLTGAEEQITDDFQNQYSPQICQDNISWVDYLGEGKFDIYLYNIPTVTKSKVGAMEDMLYMLLPIPQVFQFTSLSKYKLVWYSFIQTTSDMYVYDINTGQTTQITNDQEMQCHPTIYGNKLVWTEALDFQSGFHLVSYDLVTQEKQILTKNFASQLYPCLSDKYLVWKDYRDSGEPLFWFGLFGDFYMMESNMDSELVKPTVTDDGAYTASDKVLSAHWYMQGNSNVASYQYWIGTTPGASDVVLPIMTYQTSITANNLSLKSGKTYYFTVRGRNASGLWTEPGYSDGITVDAQAPEILDTTLQEQSVGAAIWFEATVPDSIAGVDKVVLAVKMKVEGAWRWKYYQMTNLGFDWFYSVIPAINEEAIVPYKLFAQDKVGNKSETEIKYIKIR